MADLLGRRGVPLPGGAAGYVLPLLAWGALGLVLVPVLRKATWDDVRAGRAPRWALLWPAGAALLGVLAATSARRLPPHAFAVALVLAFGVLALAMGVRELTRVRQRAPGTAVPPEPTGTAVPPEPTGTAVPPEPS